MPHDTDTESFESLLLSMGYVTGALTRPSMFTALVESLRNGGLESGHVVFLRDTLTRALRLAGVESQP